MIRRVNWVVGILPPVLPDDISAPHTGVSLIMRLFCQAGKRICVEVIKPDVAGVVCVAELR